VSLLKYHQAVRDAVAEELRRDPTTFLMGEDIGASGGVYGQTRGLFEEFGPERVRDTPAAETGFLGAAVGAAITGLRPIVEVSFADFLAVCLDPIVNHAAKIRYMSGGQVAVPLTVLTFGGGGLAAGPQHSGSYEGVLAGFPGLRVLMPATPGDVKGLVKAAVRDDNPVVVVMHKGLVQTKEDVDADPDRVLPIGAAAVLRQGRDVTVVTYSGGVRKALAAAEALAGEGIDAEVVDLRSVQPLDMDTVLESVRRTSRAVVFQETYGFGGVGAEVAARIGTDAFDWLDAPVLRISHPLVPVPFNATLEEELMPGAADLVAACRSVTA
jgi:pyruvate/2-oxoglutarate/acetoin dehydrogenase E1 component